VVAGSRRVWLLVVVAVDVGGLVADVVVDVVVSLA
jgi:hypothetical protein